MNNILPSDVLIPSNAFNKTAKEIFYFLSDAYLFTKIASTLNINKYIFK
jgi:hypothetical protein